MVDAIKRKKALIENGDGPVLLETITYRYSGHSPSDASSYRLKEEIDAWQAIDPLHAYAKELTDGGMLSEEGIDQRQADVTKAMTQAYRLASDLGYFSPIGFRKNRWTHVLQEKSREL